MKTSFAAGALVLAVAAGGAVRADRLLERGQYLSRVMDCGGCHTPMTASGPDFARAYTGGLGFEVPGLGVFFAPNLTGDRETGLGGWSDEEILAAVTRGERPDGRILAPIMPYASYAALTPEDGAALVAWLRSLQAVESRVPGPFGPGEAVPVPYFGLVLPE